MSSEDSSSYCSDSDDDDYDGGGGGRRLDIPHSALTEVQDYAQAYAPLDTDVLGQDSSGDDDDDFLPFFGSNFSPDDDIVLYI